MPLDYSKGIIMTKEQSDKYSNFDLQVKAQTKDGQRLRVVEVRYIPTPDAGTRLRRVFDILLATMLSPEPCESPRVDQEIQTPPSREVRDEDATPDGPNGDIAHDT